MPLASPACSLDMECAAETRVRLDLSALPPRKNRDWVCTNNTRNAFGHNHLVDMLDVHAANCELQRDDQLPNWRPSASFAYRLRALGAEFRRQVTGAFARRIGFDNLLCVPSDEACLSVGEQSECTSNAMQSGIKMIVGAVLTDHTSNVFARVPILLRADVADEIFNLGIEHECDDQRLVYIAVAIKRRPVETKGSAVLKKRCLEKLQKEVFLWNLLLSQSQRHDVRRALIIGLHPKRKKAVATGAMPLKPRAAESKQPSLAVFDKKVWKLAVLAFDDLKHYARRSALDALKWRIDVMDEGRAWLMNGIKQMSKLSASPSFPHLAHSANPMYALVCTTSDPRLRPNMKSPPMFDWPWETAKRKLAHDLRELTLVSGISRSAAEEAMAKGIPNDYSHHAVTAEALGSNSLFTTEVLIKNKPEYKGPVVTPRIIPHNRSNWRLLQEFHQQYPHRFSKNGQMLPGIEQRSFYVDFELASAEHVSADDSTQLAENADPNLIHKYGETFDVYPTAPLVDEAISVALVFMIGCGQVVDGAWKHSVFISDSLDKEGEKKVILEWLQHMNELTRAQKEPPLVHVWGPEKQLLKQALRRMPQPFIRETEPLRNFVIMDVHKIVANSCVSIRGSLNNSIKNVAKALEDLGLLDDYAGRVNDGGVGKGPDAIAVALHAVELVQKKKAVSLSEVAGVKDIARYNEHDCRDVARIVAYLRKNH
ncbi:unnamed protein product [Agarophyton chilense]